MILPRVNSASALKRQSASSTLVMASSISCHLRVLHPCELFLWLDGRELLQAAHIVTTREDTWEHFHSAIVPRASGWLSPPQHFSQHIERREQTITAVTIKPKSYA